MSCRVINLLGLKLGTICQSAVAESIHRPRPNDLLLAAREVRNAKEAFAALALSAMLKRDEDWLSRWHEATVKLSKEELARRIEAAIRTETGAIYPTSSCDELCEIHWDDVADFVTRAAERHMAALWSGPCAEQEE